MSEDEVVYHSNVCFKSSIRRVLTEIAEDFQKENKLTALHLFRLRCMCGATFDRALELYESKKVTEFKVELTQHTIKNRTACCFYEVKGQSSEVYTIFPNLNFCSCLSFENQVLKEHSTFTCKHILAVWLASLTQTNLNYQTIQESKFCEVLLGRVLY
ncbi:zinc finger SWIM domain-containing protein 7-like [Phymastichus coffea]|uniref:zinc finger SWIM domain-containing protein 7-like n=1 Tax=Phymastichus coffea TaxID=108790 RepID=UPI00273C3BF3|nr:zinc finger SWIM domain-containing protein 7-like [Phymastichus coffea]